MTSDRPFSPEAARLLGRIKRGGDDDCWLWQGPVYRTGYGNAGSWFYKNMGTALVHRVAYVLLRGDLPAPPLILRHTCDTRLCCNPKHLIPGTRQDNMRDMVERGRSTKGRRTLGCGETHPRAKLTDSTIRLIFSLSGMGLSHRKIGGAVGVSGAQVGRILRGESRAQQTV